MRPMKRVAALFFAVLVLYALLSGCASSAPHGEEIADDGTPCWPCEGLQCLRGGCHPPPAGLPGWADMFETEIAMWGWHSVPVTFAYLPIAAVKAVGDVFEDRRERRKVVREYLHEADELDKLGKHQEAQRLRTRAKEISGR